MINEQLSLFETTEPEKVNIENIKRERVIYQSAEAVVTGKKKITTEAINELFGIKESFELPEVLLKKLLNKQEKDELCREFMQFEFDMRNDCLRDYFQMNNANRSNLKQDYTPDCLCHLISKLAPKTEMVIDICSGTGALTIGFNRDIQYICEEFSSMSIPVLLFNLALRGISAIVLQKNVLENSVQKVYQLTKNGKFSDIETIESYEEQKSDVVISNPPYSLKWQPKNDPRFDGYELAPAKASDYAFVLDGLSRLTETGQAFYILPAGVLYRGNAELKIRQQLIQNNLIDAVISLPENLFLNTSIAVNILVLNKAKQTDDVLFIRGDKLFKKNGKQNIMTDEHIKKIADAYWKRETIEKFSKVVSLSEIAENDYSLNLPIYVDTYEPEPLPPIEYIVKDIVNSKFKILELESEIAKIESELHGAAPEKEQLYQNAMLPFMNHIKQINAFDIASREWIAHQAIIGMSEKLSETPHKKVWILDIADIEIAKKGVIYKKGNLILQFSATDRKIRYLDKDQQVDGKYGVIKPKDINGKYLFYVLEKELPSFLERYQAGMNINPQIFKHLKIEIHTTTEAQECVVNIMKSIELLLNNKQKQIDEYKELLKFI